MRKQSDRLAALHSLKQLRQQALDAASIRLAACQQEVQVAADRLAASDQRVNAATAQARTVPGQRIDLAARDRALAHLIRLGDEANALRQELSEAEARCASCRFDAQAASIALEQVCHVIKQVELAANQDAAVAAQRDADESWLLRQTRDHQRGEAHAN